ncbi:MAG TPA: RHS repeat-associated core domain-containing protein [Chthoniobacterales bacterium]
MKKLLIISLGLMVVVGNMHGNENHKLPGISSQLREYFFTGKPYDADIGGVIFKYRNYDPSQNRWTSMDSSGFPDGVNNCKFVADPIAMFDFRGLEGKKVAFIYAYTGLSATDNSSGNGAPFIQNLVSVTMDKLQQADNKNPEWKYVSDGDYVSYGSITDPAQLASWSDYDKIYIAAHGVFDANGFTGDVIINGLNYSSGTIMTPKTESFKYCGSNTPTPWNPNGIVQNWELSGEWFHSAADYLYE